ncbi:ATP-binding cassette domain-containing protein [Paenibacillus sp. NPDC057934]|uniref:ATP-binding cassette domain-containing protein n=1 Tax=Paenibacillus sp. NPDC057934 TaxID=3346282 RepID=UPI0036DCE44D
MSENIVATNGLSKKYSSSFALMDCSLNIEKGQIYGLVGKNGAGKTTLMRLICGQSYPTSGSLSLFGNGDSRKLEESRTRIGCVIESPTFYPNLSAKKNLKIYCMKKGIPITGELDELLEFVGLSDTGRKKFSQFSLGMKERLGIARALLGKPEFLVLDEPTNGLDPLGISQIRDLILKLNQEQGVTILISSHILKELSSVATHYGFIDNGILIEQISAKELEAQSKGALVIKVSNTAKASTVLDICGYKNYKVFPQNIIRCYDQVDHPEQMNRELNENGVDVFSLTEERKDLEDYFMSLLGERSNA